MIRRREPNRCPSTRLQPAAAATLTVRRTSLRRAKPHSVPRPCFLRLNFDGQPRDEGLRGTPDGSVGAGVRTPGLRMTPERRGSVTAETYDSDRPPGGTPPTGRPLNPPVPKGCDPPGVTPSQT